MGGLIHTLYKSMGGMETCRRVSERFHAKIARDPTLSRLFPNDMTSATERFALFLAEITGGPADYTASRGKQSLQCRHSPFPIGPSEVEAWLRHMLLTIDEVGIAEPARSTLRAGFLETAPTLADPFLHYYRMNLSDLREALKQKPELVKASEMGHSLLCEAAGRWDTPRVQLILELGGDANIQGRMNHTPLYFAAGAKYPKQEPDGREVVAILIRHGANVNIHSGPGLSTPLHMTARRGTTAIAELLLDSGAEMESIDSKGETPLRRAVNCRQEGAVRLLLSRGANPLSRDKQGRTPLSMAHTESIREAMMDAVIRIANASV